MLERLRNHWPEYLIEAWALGTFMVSAGVVTTLVEHPDFGLALHPFDLATNKVLALVGRLEACAWWPVPRRHG